MVVEIRGKTMKRVKGYIYARPLGEYNFDFYVPDDTSDKEIKRLVEDRLEFAMNYEVEEGYEAYTEVKYRRRDSSSED